MKRVLALVLGLAAAIAAVYALRPAARAPSGAATSAAPAARGPTAEIDDASRAQLERVLRQAARDEPKPSAKR